MVQDILVNLFTSMVELLRLSLLLGIPMFFCAIIIAFLARKFSERFGMGFARASFFSTYLVVLALIIVLYFYPFYLGFMESNVVKQPKPPFLALTALDFIAALPAFAFKFLLDALLFTLLALPIEFAALYVFDLLKSKYAIQKTTALAASVFAAAIITVLIALFVFPFAITGLVYLLYFT